MNDDLDLVLKRFRPEHDPDNGVHYVLNSTKRLKEEALSPVDELSQVFLDQPEDEHLHIIVRCPLLNSERVYFVPLHNSKCSTFGV